MRSLRLISMLVAAVSCAATQRSPFVRGEAAIIADEIHRIASSEPLLSGLDIRLKLAQCFKTSDPGLSRQYLRECVQVAGTIHESELIDESGAELVKLYLAVATGEAEDAARALPGRTAAEGMNAREGAYDLIIDHFRRIDSGQAERLLYSAFGAGAFRLYAGQQMVLSLLEKAPPRAHELFAQFLVFLPVNRADSRDILFLLELARPVFKTNAALALQAVEKSLAALDRKGFDEESPQTLTTTYTVGDKPYGFVGRRQSLLFQVAAFLKVYQPDAYKQNQERFRAFEAALKPVESLDSVSLDVLRREKRRPRRGAQGRILVPIPQSHP